MSSQFLKKCSENRKNWDKFLQPAFTTLAPLILTTDVAKTNLPKADGLAGNLFESNIEDSVGGRTGGCLRVRDEHSGIVF